jgi:hypothetical protein
MPSTLTPLMDWSDQDIDQQVKRSALAEYTMLEYIAEKQRRQTLKAAAGIVLPTRLAAIAAGASAVAAIASLLKP